MKLKQYIHLERGNGARLAAALGVAESYLSQMAGDSRPVSPPRCVEIEKFTGGLVTRKDLREDWASTWPELAAQQDATGGQP